MNPWNIYNTHTGLKIKSYQYAERSYVFNSIEELHGGFKTWSQLSPQTRQVKLLKVIEIMEKDQDHLAQVISNEMGKSLISAQAEIKKCLETSKYLCHLDLNFLNPVTVPNTTYRESVVSYLPYGVILSILPWNYPAWQGFRAFFPALLAGNTFLIKHSEVTPTVGDLLHSYFKQAGLGDILQHQLFSHDLSEEVMAHPHIQGACITGSVTAGNAIAKLCSKYLKKCVLELGGSDPSIVLADCDLPTTFNIIARSRLQNAGQVCISAKRVFVPSSYLKVMCEQMIESYKLMLCGENNLVGPLADVRFKKDYDRQVAELKIASEVIFEKDMNSKNLNDQTAFVNPVILLFDHHHEILKTMEVFGPCLIVVPYETVDEAITMANSTIFGLGASVYGSSISDCQAVASQIKAGQVSINDFVNSDICLPFGGYKMSGLGRESGQNGFFEFTQTRVISVNK